MKIRADKIVTGGQTLPLFEVRHVDCYADIQFRSYRYVAYSLGIFVAIGAAMLLLAYLADVTGTGSSPIWPILLSLIFFGGGELFFGFFLYGAVSSPTVWLVTVKHDYKKSWLCIRQRIESKPIR